MSLATAVSCGWQKAHDTVATEGKTIYPKAASPSYVSLYIINFVRKYTEFGFFGFDILLVFVGFFFPPWANEQHK